MAYSGCIMIAAFPREESSVFRKDHTMLILNICIYCVCDGKGECINRLPSAKISD